MQLPWFCAAEYTYYKEAETDVEIVATAKALTNVINVVGAEILSTIRET